ncbi:hypothetical protein HD599_001393 [Conyzicola lurida]|uniref:J domain-containing protein n=1 Tax=Conyzicola lurida TaxID=1172621 RepID=A0A841AGW5_9MICO|nr:J domain-containing protein [Conyzicola lurida]MBB5843070.1 hypothetical protein [Conyzicola lurida]
MSPEEAAALLGVSVDATPAEVERAYRRRARTVHPDRLVGASDGQITSAAGEFARLTRAHESMLRHLADRPVEAILEPEYGSRPAPPRWVILGWLGVILVAGVISFYGGVFPYSTADVVLRLLPLAAVATAYALTSKPVFYAATLALLAVSVLVTLALATFGSLIALGLLVLPVVGLLVLGRRARM